MKKVFIILSFMFALFSCQKDYTTIDGTSKETFQASVNSISSKLTILQQDKIQEAIKLIYKYKTQGTDDTQRWSEVYKLLNGKNADQVFDMAEEIAKANKIPWSSTSMNSLDSSIFDENVQPMTEADEQLQQIDRATKVVLRYTPAEINDGILLYPNLIDDEGNTVDYKNLPLTATISFLNNGTVVYVTQKTISSSDVGNVSLKKGIKIPYNMFDKEKIPTGIVNIEIKISAGDRYLYGKLSHVSIDLSKTKETISEGDPIDAQIGLDNVKSFIQNIGNKNYSKAYGLTKNPKWDSEEQFASTSNGFGTIDNTNFLTSEVVNSSPNKMTIFALYQIKDKAGKVKTLKQNFILQKINENWLITGTETKEVKEDAWK